MPIQCDQGLPLKRSASPPHRLRIQITMTATRMAAAIARNATVSPTEPRIEHPCQTRQLQRRRSRPQLKAMPWEGALVVPLPVGAARSPEAGLGPLA